MSTSQRTEYWSELVNENYFSVFKRGMKGVYQHCSEKRLHRTPPEGFEGKRLTYREHRLQRYPRGHKVANPLWPRRFFAEPLVKGGPPDIYCQAWQQLPAPLGPAMLPRRKLASHLRRAREFTTAEASAVTGISVARINHYIARELSTLGVTTWGDGKRRLIGHDALVALQLADDFPRSLTPQARLEVIQKALAHPKKKDIVLSDRISVPVGISRKRVTEGLFRLQQATSAVVSDARTLQGAPCFKGTRIPVHVVAGVATAGGVDAAKTTYSRLTRSRIELACTYAKAYPQRGRPRRAGDVLSQRKPKRSRTMSVVID